MYRVFTCMNSIGLDFIHILNRICFLKENIYKGLSHFDTWEDGLLTRLTYLPVC